MEVSINDLYEGGRFVATSEYYAINGGFKKNPTIGKVSSFDGSITTTSGENVGRVNAYWSEGKLKYNLDDVSDDHLSGVASVVAQIASEIESAE